MKMNKTEKKGRFLSKKKVDVYLEHKKPQFKLLI